MPTVREAKRALSAAQKAYRNRVREARKQLEEAERAHRRQVKDAERARDQAEKDYARRVRDAEKELAQAETGRLVAAYGRVRLYDNRLEAPEGTVELSRRIKAKVESSGRQTSKRDTRQLYLLLDTPAFDSAVRCNPDHKPQVRALAAAIGTAAKNADALIREHDERLEAARNRLERVRADRSGTEAAAARLVEVAGDTATIDDLRARLAATEADTTEVDARAADLLALDPTAKIRPPKRPTGGVRASRPSLRPIGDWWRDRSKKAKAGLVVAAVFFLLI
ncbi:MAG: hypothetical protein M3321_01475, partial [Actinomycetota bacterium]|nr:hypothetical protein [Actinomycetota bacterium]